MKTVYAIGEYIIDFLEEENYSFKAHPGGAPANVAACVSLLGGTSSLITTLGNDIFKDFLLKLIKETRVEINHVSLIDKKNMLAFVSLNKEGDRTFSFYQTDTANLYLNKLAISEINFKNDILHFCSVSLQNDNNRNSHLEAIKKVKNKKGIISFDPNLRFNLWNDVEKLKAVAKRFFKYANIIKLSLEELYFLTNITNEKEAVKKLWHDELVVLWITKGKDGASVYTKEKHANVKGIKVNVLDTTGAGDAFIGSVLYKIQELDCELTEVPFEKWIEITRFANEKAAFSTMYNGAISAYKQAFNQK
jgi:fructokinase